MLTLKNTVTVDIFGRFARFCGNSDVAKCPGPELSHLRSDAVASAGRESTLETHDSSAVLVRNLSSRPRGGYQENSRTTTPLARLTKTGRSRITRANCPR